MPFKPGEIPEGAKPWKEGDPSPNPSGRPKGSKNLSTVLKEMLEEELEVIIDGVKVKKAFKDLIVRKLIKKANDGDLRAIQEIFDRVEGKAKQEIQHDINTGIGIFNIDPLADDPANNSPSENSAT
jgi:hypothetical protein